MIIRKQKKIFTTIEYIEHILIFVSTITGCISISACAFLIGISIRITSSPIQLNIWVIAAEIEMYKLITKKKKKKHDKIAFLVKS